MYGPHDDASRRILWYELLQVHANSSKRLCLMGDFNVVRNAGERKGSTFHQRHRAEFNDFINAADLQDMKLGGRRYTWIGIRGTKLSKLDRFLVSSNLLNECPQVSVLALDRTFVNHCPLLMKLGAANYSPALFRFFDHSMDRPGFEDLISKHWPSFAVFGNPLKRLQLKLKALKGAIKSWRSEDNNNMVHIASKAMAAWELRAEAAEFSPEDI